MTEGEMRLRLELFVRDLDRSIAFYRRVLGFEVLREEPGYVSMRCGTVTIGLGPIAKLSREDGYFTRTRLERERGLGVEIVLEVADVQFWERRVRASGHPFEEGLQLRPWGLTDFRLVDPDGYYLRVTSRP